MQKKSCERGCQRIPISTKAELISNDENYCAVIENVSAHGMGLKIIHNNSKSILKVEPEIVITFRTPCQKTMSLNGNKRWAYKIAPASLIENIGVEITGGISKYYDFYNSPG